MSNLVMPSNGASNSHDQALEVFAFKGHSVRVVMCDGEPAIVGKDACEALGIGNSRDAINRLDPDGVGNADVIDSLGRTQVVKALKEPAIYELIFQSRVPAAQDFKRWVTREVLPSIRKKGGYINPGASEHQRNALMFELRSQMELAQAAKGLIHKDFLEAKARLILARGMGEVPQLDPATRPLYVQQFLKEKGLSNKQLQSKASGFGKRLKSRWKSVHGCVPQKAPVELPNGRVIDVYGYTEADRPLMEQVWEAHYAA